MNQKRSIRLLVVDDSSAVMDAFVAAMEPYDSIDVVGTASNGVDAVDLTRELQPDIVLMDIRMPAMDGIKATRAIMREGLPSRVLMMTASDDDTFVREATDAGAVGYLVKGTLIADAVKALEATMLRPWSDPNASNSS
jgi:two-component system nitrate/nitrite response regulator NarL